MELIRIPHNLESCPICNGEVEYTETGAHCLKCNEIFGYNSKRKLWKNENILDISYQDPESSVLSNLFPHKFTMYIDNGYNKVELASMEAFFRCLCCDGLDSRIFPEIACLSGMDSYRVRHALVDWRKSGMLSWDSKVFYRDSEHYQNLLKEAYDQLFDCSILFREALKKTKGKILMHSIGKTDTKETLLTKYEYIAMLNRERERF